MYEHGNRCEDINLYLDLAVQYWASFSASLISTFLIYRREMKLSLLVVVRGNEIKYLVQ